MSREPIGNPAFETDNWYQIPRLRLDMQVERLELPLVRWGRENRKSRIRGTVHFYTDDSKFSRLWSRPADMLSCGAHALVEPNFSVHAQTPRVAALYATYKKRWLARLYQDYGFRVIVDLNVASEHQELALIGVPHGWAAYATRGSVHRLGDLQAELTLAKTHAGRESVLFVIYGGGQAVEREAARLGVVWVPEESEVVRGR